MNKIIKVKLSKINFALGRNPKIERRKDFRKFISEPYQAVIIISADFELAWAPRYSKVFDDPLKSSLELARRERENLPKILKLCDEFNIPITWATVGHLFLKECKRENGIAHKEIPKVNTYQGPYWDFKSKDWFVKNKEKVDHRRSRDATGQSRKNALLAVAGNNTVKIKQRAIRIIRAIPLQTLKSHWVE